MNLVQPDDRDGVLPQECIHCSIASAARTFGRKRLDALSRKVIFRLQRMPASGVYGADYNFRTVWDEYCFEAQNGPTEQLEWAWDITIEPFLRELTGNLADDEGVLLTYAAAWDLQSEQPDDDPGFDDTLIRRGIRSALDESAGQRCLDRFATWY